jgi:hypothetical protein
MLVTSVHWCWHVALILDSTICLHHHQLHLLGSWFAQTSDYSRCQNSTQACQHSVASNVSWFSSFASQNAGNLWHLSWPWRLGWVYEWMHNHWHAILFIRCRSKQGYKKVTSSYCKCLLAFSGTVRFSFPLFLYVSHRKSESIVDFISPCSVPFCSSCHRLMLHLYLFWCLSDCVLWMNLVYTVFIP